MFEELNDLVPSDYLSITLAHHVLFDTDFRTLAPECVICTKLGHLVELKNQRVIQLCDLYSKHPEKIVPMVVYGDEEENVDVVYIVQHSGHVLEVVTRKPELKSQQIEKEVIDWKVGDFSNVGYPELMIQGPDGAWRTLSFTDNDDSEQNVVSNDLIEPLERKIEQMKVKIERTKSAIAAKDNLVASVQAQPRADNSLTVTACHFLRHHGRLICAVRLRHSGDPEVKNVHLVAFDASTYGPIMMYQPSPIAVFEKDGEACRVSIIEPESLTRCVLHCVIVYKTLNQLHTLTLPKFDIAADNLVKSGLDSLELADQVEVLRHGSGALRVFRLRSAEAVATQVWDTFRQTLSKSWVRTLREARDFAVCRFVGESSIASELAGGYVIVYFARKALLFCARDDDQLDSAQLVLTSLAPDGSTIEAVEVEEFEQPEGEREPSTAKACLLHEAEWVEQHSQFAGVPVSNEEYKPFYEELIKRSAATDAAFAREGIVLSKAEDNPLMRELLNITAAHFPMPPELPIPPPPPCP